ncbi:hypothetical protein FPZ43_10050 [Mucilaginibacter pallidiroseus]|uniref:Uncharacterized protein n=1 Tax=Mucilaginibacter pallidiroseus TaxID=2599295 RepID=A0A563UD85_9SPHI|nr:hypothetical protein [Mucilaginibacter pallidiroseus]TWR29294.1 hypothetical protein FPZ43_10050 [Mucilaginibacter pallidiroseus]
MKHLILKYLFVLVCTITVLQNSGAGVLSMFFPDDDVIALQITNTANDDEDAPERSEKEINFQEYFFTHLYIDVTPQCITCSPVGYADEQNNHHLGWVTPVPTPPPNQLA